MTPEQVDEKIKEVDNLISGFDYPDNEPYAFQAGMVKMKLHEARAALQKLRVQLAEVKEEPEDDDDKQIMTIDEKFECLRDLCDNTPNSEVKRFRSWSNWDQCPHINLLEQLRDSWGDRGANMTLAEAFEYWCEDLSLDEQEEVLDWAIQEGDKIVKNDW